MDNKDKIKLFEEIYNEDTEHISDLPYITGNCTPYMPNRQIWDRYGKKQFVLTDKQYRGNSKLDVNEMLDSPLHCEKGYGADHHALNSGVFKCTGLDFYKDNGNHTYEAVISYIIYDSMLENTARLMVFVDGRYSTPYLNDREIKLDDDREMEFGYQLETPDSENLEEEYDDDSDFLEALNKQLSIILGIDDLEKLKYKIEEELEYEINH